jgi:hypothetical protein
MRIEPAGFANWYKLGSFHPFLSDPGTIAEDSFPDRKKWGAEAPRLETETARPKAGRLLMPHQSPITRFLKQLRPPRHTPPLHLIRGYPQALPAPRGWIRS